MWIVRPPLSEVTKNYANSQCKSKTKWKIPNNNSHLSIFLYFSTVCRVGRNTWRQKSNLIMYFNHMRFVRRKETFLLMANTCIRRHAFKSYFFSTDKLKTKQWIHQKLPIISNNLALKLMQSIIKYQTRVRRSALIPNIQWFVSYFFKTKCHSELFRGDYHQGSVVISH
jgi:hypothetical protein